MTEEKQEVAIKKETGRIEAFSDGVFAVAITLLVFDLKVPQPPAGETFSIAGLGKALYLQWPSYIAFITSFATILIMWVSHHSIFKLVDKSNKPFLFANGFLLMLVTVVPFPTSLVSAYLTTPAAATACAAYSGIFVVINLAYNLLWWTITRHGRLLNPAVSPAQVRALTRNFQLGFPLYLLATLLAFLNPYVTIAICSGLWIFWAFTSFDRIPVTAALPETRM
ncbi:MAG TPA: TMEM175 family protein [Ktedonobacteraceae bacterium]